MNEQLLKKSGAQMLYRLGENSEKPCGGGGGGASTEITSVSLQLALDCTANTIKNSTVELPLLTDEIMDLLNLCLTSTYFQYNVKHYKQLHSR